MRLLLSIVFSVFYFTGVAQLCSGSLGDPVVNITFDENNSAAYAPNYRAVSSSCPRDGEYTITNYTSSCFNNTWHSLTGDRTGTSAFMLVNASFEPGDFFVDTIGGLCPNTTYEFAAWVVNVLNRFGIRPNLTFKIERLDGSVLASYETGDINHTASNPEWKQYGLYFATPVTEPRVVLRITNNAPGGNGNDLALDDITFKPCGAKITARNINYTDTVHICDGDRTLFNLEASIAADYITPVYVWQLSTDKGKTWTDMPDVRTLTYQRKPTAAGIYWYRLAVTEAATVGIKACRIASNALVIHVHPNPEVDAGPDRVLIRGDNIMLSGTAKGEEVKFLWSPTTAMNDASLQQPSVNPQSDIQYSLSAISRYGCTNTDNMQVRVVKDIYVPNAFTPNGDGKNDLWRVPFLDPVLRAQVRLFNRHGQLVYYSDNGRVEWNGKMNGALQPSGVYVYLIKTGKREFKGVLTLIR